MASKRICEVPGCGKPRFGRGLCQMHYMRERRKAAPPCSIEGCGKPIESRGLCQKHLTSLIRHGDPLKLISIPKGEAAKFVEDALSYRGSECLLWPFSRDMQGRAQMTRDGVHIMVHRYVCAAIYGPPPPSKNEVAHACGQGHLGCIAPQHLRWADRKENAEDMVAHGTSLRGTRHPRSKLTPDDVRQIRALEGTASQSAIGERFGVSGSVVGKIHSGKSWAWLK